MGKTIKKITTTKLELKDAYFNEEGIVCVQTKDGEEIEVQLVEELQRLFGYNDFTLSANLKTEKELDEE